MDPQRVGSVEAEVDVVVVCLHGGSDESAAVRAGSNAELSWGPMTVMRAAKSSTLIAVATILMKAPGVR